MSVSLYLFNFIHLGHIGLREQPNAICTNVVGKLYKKVNGFDKKTYL